MIDDLMTFTRTSAADTSSARKAIRRENSCFPFAQQLWAAGVLRVDHDNTFKKEKNTTKIILLAEHYMHKYIRLVQSSTDSIHV